MLCLSRISFRTSVVLLALVCTACGTDSTTPSSRTDLGLPDAFEEFYDKFHEDTAYQMQHISFPLEGLRAFSSIDSSVQNRPWTKNEWVYHSRIDPEIGYQVEFDVLTDEFITETITDTSGTYAMQRRFALTSDGWQLIYYVEMQPASPANN